jgi:hypothetical protein
MRLTDKVMLAVEAARVDVSFVNRDTTRWWNERRGQGELRYFTGWYWVRKDARNRIDGDQNGPFHSMSAAVRDAYTRLQLR